jgi:hypothetical protein
MVAALVSRRFSSAPLAAPGGGFGIDDAATDEAFINLAVEVVPIRHNHEREIPGHHPADFLDKENHRVGFHAALCLPEYSESAEIRVRSPDQGKFRRCAAVRTQWQLFSMAQWLRM